MRHAGCDLRHHRCRACDADTARDEEAKCEREEETLIYGPLEKHADDAIEIHLRIRR
jgi:hypothetical protein